MGQATPGDFVLLDPKDYFKVPEGHNSNMFGRVTHVDVGGSSTYPVKVEFQNGLTGQFKHEEIKANTGKLLWNTAKTTVVVKLLRQGSGVGERFMAEAHFGEGFVISTGHQVTRGRMLELWDAIMEFFNLLQE